MKIVNSLEESSSLIKSVIETIENEAKEQNGGFLNMILVTLGASLVGNLLAGKGVMQAVEEMIRAVQDF